MDVEPLLAAMGCSDPAPVSEKLKKVRKRPKRRRRSKKRWVDPHGFYVEPVEVVQALAEEEEIVGDILDPCCGIGTVCRVFEARGHNVEGSDLIDRGYGVGGVDFLDPSAPIEGADNIIMNPPYGQAVLAKLFIDRALELARDVVAAVVETRFLHSVGRYYWYQERRPYAVITISRRPSMPPGKLLLAGEVEPGGGKQDYTWLVYRRDYDGPTLHKWVLAPEPLELLPWQKEVFEALYGDAAEDAS